MSGKIKQVIFLLLCSIMWGPILSQNMPSHIKKNLVLADEAYEIADYMKAFNLYKTVLPYDSTNGEILFKSGICLFGINKNDTTCISYFKKSSKDIPESHYYLGRAYQLKGLTKRALDELYYFKTINSQENISGNEVNLIIRACENSLMQQNRKENYIIKNLGAEINSVYPEYVPLVWKENNSLIFTSRRDNSIGGLKDPYGRYYEDVYIAGNDHGLWKSPIPIPGRINTSTHDACVAFSPDGNELIIYRTDAKQTGGDLYITKYDSGQWSEPIIMPKEINSDYLEASACYSGEGDEIIFSSNRPGGFGGKDLYKVRKFMNGKYSLPFNLGPNINTSQDEDAPFIDKIDNTLYFSSKGHNSIGEYDIFQSDFNPETGKWTLAKNLGMPINSTNDDIYFIKQDEKPIALFTSRREGGFGDADIYEVNFETGPEAIVHCYLKFPDMEKGDLKDLQLTLINTESGSQEGLYRPNKNLMSMILIAALNKPYKIILEGKNIEPLILNTIFTKSNEELELTIVKRLK